ncbi:MAG: isoleucine--tRNA ligase, partial [Gammaproteobacteria bacterium]|nr:isoleucine--tRNA ligase [Gammaproteobacteria bacterium]
MRANLSQREPGMLEAWYADSLYERIREAAAGRPKYILADGPPYANGKIHMGHAVNKVLKDIVVRFKTLDGFDAPYIPGWDCHGLPMELREEKKHGRVGRKLDVNAFRKACRDYAMKQVDGQRTEFKRLGVLGQWDDPYLTMKPQYEGEQLRALARIIDNGHVYKGYKPVHWCLDCRSALAEAEVEYQDKTSPAIDVRFVVTDHNDFYERSGIAASDVPVSIPIWTTTPWTIPGNQAVALHPEIEYTLVEADVGAGMERLLLATELIEPVMQRLGSEDYATLGTMTGQVLNKLVLQHPIYDRPSPVIVADHVTLDAGTGAVHTAPGHGQEDFAAGLANDLPLDNPVGSDGCFLPSTELFAGMQVHKANKSIVETLDERGALLHHEPYQHSYPHCWRHKSPVIFRATPQWFVSMDAGGLRQRALEEIEKVRWTPGWGQQRIESMVEGRPDWCISRQRVWGVPIAVFAHKETHELHPRSVEILEQIAASISDDVDSWAAWEQADPTTLLGDDADDYEKVTDTMDVWFDSGCMHYCATNLHEPLERPADLYLEGSDQHRGWFQSSLLTSVAMFAEAPYRGVLTHGFTVDEDGRKMSKSLGNIVEPQTIAKSLGADVLRLWVAATDYSGEMSVSDEILKRMADSYRRIRNTARFLLGNLHGFDPDQHAVAEKDMLDLDRWAVTTTAELGRDIHAAYETFEFHHIYQRLHNFCVVQMGGFYLDIIKDRLYTMPTNSRGRRSAQTAMWHIAEAMVRWLAPVLSFTAEEIWAELPGERAASVMLSEWYVPPAGEGTRADWDRLIAIRDAASRELEHARENGEIGSSLAAIVEIFCR